MDHHCYFLNKCVGKGNAKQFVLFAFYLKLLIETGVVFTIYFKFFQEKEKELEDLGPYNLCYMFT